MLEYLIHLSYDSLGQNVLGYLELSDIIQFEIAAASHGSQQLIKDIVSYCPPITLSDSFNEVKSKNDAFKWFNKRGICIQHATILVDTLCEVNFQYYIFDSIELCLNLTMTLDDIELLKNPYIIQRVTSIKIQSEQDPAVMEVLFSLFSNCNNGNVRSLDLVSSNLPQWMEHIKKIGPCLRELTINCIAEHSKIFTILSAYCPYLESIKCRLRVSDSSNILQIIAANYPHLHSLAIKLKYNTSAEADADLTAFAEKCPQLEELSLTCQQLTDKSVIALAQHCSRLKKFKLDYSKITTNSLIALSERGLPLEELYVPWIRIPSVEIAAQCAHALSRIREVSSESYYGTLHYAIQYMTGLRKLSLDCSYDDMLPILQVHCADLEFIKIWTSSTITPQHLSEIAKRCSKLRTYCTINPYCTSDAVLVEMAHNCSHLQEFILDCSPKVTEKGVQALAAHCKQLRKIDIRETKITEDTVRQLAQYCRHLTFLRAVQKGILKWELNKKKLRAII